MCVFILSHSLGFIVIVIIYTKKTIIKGDHNEVARHVTSGGSSSDALKSFMPASLTCLNSFLPSVLLNKGPQITEVIIYNIYKSYL